MKLNGRKLPPPEAQILVIPREDGDFVFKAQAVTDYADFRKLVPEPQPPHIQRRGESKSSPNLDDDGYKKAVREYGTKQTQYLILQSLAATPGLEWETVKLDDPSTWANYESELKDSGLVDVEIVKLHDLVTAANGMDEAKYMEARKRFLAGQVETAQ